MDYDPLATCGSARLAAGPHPGGSAAKPAHLGTTGPRPRLSAGSPVANAYEAADPGTRQSVNGRGGSNRPRSTSKRGRPTRLTVERLLSGAHEIGLERITMKALAVHLGVGVATVYRFARSKDELIRLATMAKTERPGFVARHEQSWREFAGAFAREIRQLHVEQPQLIALIIAGGVGPEIEAAPLEHFLQALTERGVMSHWAVALYHALGSLALGAAVTLSHDRALASAALPRGPILGLIANEAGLAALRDHLPAIASFDHDAGFDLALCAILDGFETAMDMEEPFEGSRAVPSAGAEVSSTNDFDDRRHAGPPYENTVSG